MHSRIVSSGIPQKEEKDLRMDYLKVSCDDSLYPTKQLAHSTTKSFSTQPVPSVNTVAMSQSGVNLTLERIATLSLLPNIFKSFEPYGRHTLFDLMLGRNGDFMDDHTSGGLAVFELEAITILSSHEDRVAIRSSIKVSQDWDTITVFTIGTLHWKRFKS